MSATTAFFVALTALLTVVADLVSEKGPLYKIAAAGRGWWRARHPLPVTPAERQATEEKKTDERIEDLREHVEILKGLAATASEAAAQAKAAAEAASESAAFARRELDRVTSLLDRFHLWAVTWWPVMRTDAARLGVPDPPMMSDLAEEHP